MGPTQYNVRLGRAYGYGFPRHPRAESNGEKRPVAELDARLLGDLRCPVTRAELVQHGDWLYSKDPRAPRKYPIRNGIPVLLVEAGVAIDDSEFERVVGSTSTDRTEN